MAQITEATNVAGTAFRVGQRVEYHAGEHGWLSGTVRGIDDGPRVTYLRVEIDQPEFLSGYDRPYELNAQSAASFGCATYNPLLHRGKSMGNFRPLEA
jgi:hypothetical protein